MANLETVETRSGSHAARAGCAVNLVSAFWFGLRPRPGGFAGFGTDPASSPFVSLDLPRLEAAVRAEYVKMEHRTRERHAAARRIGRPDVSAVEAWLVSNRADLLPFRWNDWRWRHDATMALFADEDRGWALRRMILAFDDWEDAQGGEKETFNPEEILPRFRDESRDGARVVAEAVNRAAWCGSRVIVIPSWNPAAEHIGAFSVEVHGGTEDPASFTLFTREGAGATVDDVLEGGDADFFPPTPAGATLQADYFDLIAEIRKPGSSAKPGRVITLYTARPVADRAQFVGAARIPVNVFLTSSFDDAEGIARDFGGRDVWRVKLNTRDLVITLDSPRVKQYQITAASGAEVAGRPDLVMEGA